MEDQRDAVAAMLARVETANEERLPWAMVKRLSAGENPVLVWREHRGMTREALAAASAVPESVIAAVEAGACEPALRPMVALARALRADLDDLVPWAQE
jgi:DNA-binding XRE family transcriptional regulator